MRTEETLADLVLELEGNCGDFYGACKVVGVSPAFVRKWQKDDPKVNETIEEACRVGAMQIEHAVIKRAVHGVKEDIYYQGEVVGSKQVYSDGLLTLLAKKRLKDVYGDDAASTNVNVNVNNIQIPRATTYEDWLRMAQLNHEALPAPEQEPEYVDFTNVLPPPELDPAMADIL